MIKKLKLQQNLLGLISANVDAGEGDRRLHFSNRYEILLQF
jgi:hypothetical protein